MKKNLKKSIFILSSILFILLVIIFGYLYTGQNKAYSSDIEFLNKNATFENSYYKIDNNSTNGFIFYPGAKVPPESYAYLSNIDNANVYIAKFPFNFAFFKPNIATKIIEDNKNIKHWYIGGHSLGGVFAYNYANNNSNIINGVIFLASYPTNKIPEESPLRILSLYGSNDGVVGDYSNKFKLFNKDSKLVEINGANHTQFGSYDLQKGDNDSSISLEEQHNIVIQNIKNFINN